MLAPVRVLVPAPPSMLTSELAAAVRLKLSVPVPPTSFSIPEKVKACRWRCQWASPAADIVQVLVVLVPVRVSVVAELPTKTPILLKPPVAVAALVCRLTAIALPPLPE